MIPAEIKLFPMPPNDNIFTNATRFLAVSNGQDYDSSQPKYWYPSIQAYDDINEYYICEKKLFNLVNVVEGKKLGNMYGYDNLDVYVMLKNYIDFDKSTLPEHKYKFVKLRAISNDTFIMSTITKGMIDGKECLILLPNLTCSEMSDDLIQYIFMTFELSIISTMFIKFMLIKNKQHNNIVDSSIDIVKI